MRSLLRREKSCAKEDTEDHNQDTINHKTHGHKNNNKPKKIPNFHLAGAPAKTRIISVANVLNTALCTIPPPVGINVHVHAEAVMHSRRIEASENGNAKFTEFETESGSPNFSSKNFEDQKDAHHEIKGCFFARSSIYFRSGGSKRRGGRKRRGGGSRRNIDEEEPTRGHGHGRHKSRHRTHHQTPM